jgi:molybdopterin-guanine dinucleotide biosynthesis protein A
MPSAAILMGGEARRFGGRDKSGLLIGGRTILERQIDELSEIADDILIVGSRQNPVKAAGHHVRFIPDRVAGCGPLGGLDAALAAAQSDVLVVVACDMPFVTAAFLRHLQALTYGADAIVPRTERGYHPVCAAYTQACRPAVETALAEHRLSMGELLKRIRVRVVEAGEIDAFGPRARLLANVNTPAELDELAALSSHQL